MRSATGTCCSLSRLRTHSVAATHRRLSSSTPTRSRPATAPPTGTPRPRQRTSWLTLRPTSVLEFVDLRLPNLFGEHGRPFYNAVTATFCHILAEGGQPKVENDKELTLLHAQNAADLLIGNASLEDQSQLEVRETVSGLLERLATLRADLPHRRDPRHRHRLRSRPVQHLPLLHVRVADADQAHAARGRSRLVLRDHPLARRPRPVVLLDDGSRHHPW